MPIYRLTNIIISPSKLTLKALVNIDEVINKKCEKIVFYR